MITQSQAMNALVASIGLLLCWVVVAFLYRDYRVDLFRNRMFAVRDDLFDYAAGGGIDFDHPAYTLLRTTMNGFIRFGDRINLWSMLATAWAFREGIPEGDTFTAQLQAAVTDLTPSQRENIDRAVLKMHLTVADQIIYTSLVLTLVLAPVQLVLMAKYAGAKVARGLLKRAYPPRLSIPFDSFALTYGGQMAYT